jgi:hypothetical protein
MPYFSNTNIQIETNTNVLTVWQCVVTIHVKSLTHAPMRFELGVISNEIHQRFNHNTHIFYETNGQSNQIKEHINPIANASQT